ncbi:unnamed protein product [Rotaria socialis]|uniref:PLD phosphodiesterase domain-containing protein n=1 Tax=Rotaria socialis TaxID=392032 RepID=A0A821EYW5_9BILA|nr:unnamed protein product [Rotaria socialis]
MASSTAIETSNNELDEGEKYRLPRDNILQQTVTSVFASGYPSIKSPEEAVKFLFSKHHHHLWHKIKHKIVHHEVTQEEIDVAARFGRFFQRPSDLFLKLFYSVICTLKHDPLAGRVSPAVIGSTGVIPLTIISTIPDIMRHYYHIIVHAQKEILFSTMYWEKSESANIIGKAFLDLSKCAGCENRHVIIKLMMDHPTISNATQFHSIIPPSKWSYYNIPSPEEIPNISLEVHNYHHIIMGTFHVKVLIVDRKLALLNSNNIQDRPNLEMMSHYEGDIVNSFHDRFLISWWLPFQPNLVCLNNNAPMEQYFHFGFDSSTIASVKESICEAIATAGSRLKHLEVEEAQHLNKSSKSVRSTIADKNISAEEMEALSLEFSPFLFHRPHEPFPIALVNRLPNGIPGHRDTTNPQHAVFMGAFRYAQKSIFIQSPTLNASPAIDGIVAASRRGIKVTLWLNLSFNDLKEGHGTFQGGTNEHVVKKLYKKLAKANDGTERNLEIFWYTGKYQVRPLHFLQKKRNCHIKFMSIDGQVAIMGNANMDSLSWFHSQEVNAMIDSPMIVKYWMDALYRNQATNAYGRLDSDEIWRDAQGQLNTKNGK